MRQKRVKTTSAKAKQPVRKAVYSYLRRRILDGKLNYGERLIEAEIADKFKVSRTPVREAFRKLENEGLVEYSPGRGVTVTKLSLEDMLELYAIRGALEGLAVRLAAKRITGGELQKLNALLEEMATGYQNKEYLNTVALHTQFNDLIYRAARSPRLYEMVTRFHEYTERSQLRALSLPYRFEAIQDEHQRIVQALESKEPDRAEEAVRYHIEQARRAYLATLAPLANELTA